MHKAHLGLSAARKSGSPAILTLHRTQLSAASALFSENSASQGKGTCMAKMEDAEFRNRFEMSKRVTNHACFRPCNRKR